MKDLEWWKDHLGDYTDTPRGIKALCPAHDDSNPSLAVDVKGGKTLITCRAGCDTTDVIDALDGGVEPFTVTRKKRQYVGPPLAWWAKYTGVDAVIWQGLGVSVDKNNIVFNFGDLDVRKRRHAGEKSYEWEGHLSPNLWPLPGSTVGKEVHIALSESDCGALNASGLEAYTLTKGDKGLAEAFRIVRDLKSLGAETLILWTDADKTGRQARASLIDAAQANDMAVAYPDMDALTSPLLGEKDANDIYRRLGSEGLFQAAKAALVDVPQPLVTMTHAQMMDAADEEIAYDIPDLVSPGEKVVIVGRAKARKTWLALDLIRSLTTRAPFMGYAPWTPPKALKVIYVGEEGVKQKFARRIKALHIQRDTGLVRWKHRTRFSLVSEARVTALIDELRDHGTNVLILDPFQRMSGGIEENSAKETAPVWDAIARIQSELPNLTVWVVFHAGKNDDRALTLDAIRGSSRHAGELDVGIIVKKEDEQHSLVTIEGRDIPAAQREGEAFRVRFDIDLDHGLLDVNIVGTTAVKVTRTKAVDRADEIFAFIEASGPAGIEKEAIDIEGVKERSITSYIQNLVTAGRIQPLNKPSKGKKVRYAAITHGNADADNDYPHRDVVVVVNDQSPVANPDVDADVESDVSVAMSASTQEEA